MKPWRLIISPRANGAENMALDEALFQSCESLALPTLRLYHWSEACVTIGYFQKYAQWAGCGKTVTRRLTGGLAVFHGADISYALVAGEKDWPYLYDQEQSYARVHALLGEALRSLGENVEYHLPADLPAPKAEAPRSAVARSNSPAGSLCVNTFFPHDVRIGEKKIIGSCQRRRGKVLLQQGSLHHAVKGGLETFAEQVAKTGKEQLGIAFSIEGPRPDEQSAMRELLLSRYGTAAWNEKF